MPEAIEVIKGSCFCGAIQFAYQPPSRFTVHCHCSTCRRAHGAAFVTWTGVKQEQFQLVEGKEQLIRHESSPDTFRSFCSICGSTLFFESSRWEGEVHIATALLHDQPDIKPDKHVYVDHRAPWLSISDDLAQYGGESGMEPKG